MTEVAALLGESRGAAEDLLGLARDLEVKLPGTKAAFQDGVLRAAKAEIIARAVTMLYPAEARKAEAIVLDRAGRLTPGGLRAAIARAVLDVAPKKARKRREEAARDARVQRWAEDSGNAALMGRELPPGRGPGRRPADHRLGAATQGSRPRGRHGRAPCPRLPGHLAGQGLPAPPGHRAGRRRAGQPGWRSRAGRQSAGRSGWRRSGWRRVRAGRTGRTPRARAWRAGEAAGKRRGAGRVRREGHPDRAAGDPAGSGRPARRTDAIRPRGPAAPQGRDSPSRPSGSLGHPADTAPGGCALGSADGAT